VSALNTKLRRDLWRLRGQVATIALVLACAFMSMLMLRSTWHSLLDARDSYYATSRFGDVFARLVRAPDSVAQRLVEIPGVKLVYPRLVHDVMVPMPDEPDPVTGRVISLPDDGVPPLGDLYLRAGRLPAIGAADEAVILEQFATAHGLALGTRIPVVLEGRLRQIQVVGIALSPEYVLAMSGAEAMPDNRRFVVLWMSRRAIAPVFQMEGAFDDVVLQLEPHASLPGVLAEVDRVLAPYGGYHAIPRAKQLSNFALSSELGMLRTLALVIPAIFLAVAAFLVNVVVSRLVFLERTQIAVLKALGFTDRRIALHYLGLVALIVAIAAVVGIAAGARTARWMTDLYADFYRFPTRLYRIDLQLVVTTVAIGLGAAVLGAVAAVRRVTRMPPAQAMRPPAPLDYRRSVLEVLRLDRLLGPGAMMAMREIERRPLRFVMSTFGIAMGISIFLLGRFSWDSFDHLMTDTFLREHREDLTVTLRRTREAGAVQELAHLPGVELAEGQRVVPVRFRAGSRWRDTMIIGMPVRPALRQLLDHGRTPITLPVDGIVMTDELATRLGVRVGDRIETEILEGQWATRSILVAGLIDEPFGLQAYARADWLSRTLREDPRVSSVLLAVEPGREDEVREHLKQLPEVLGVSSTAHAIEQYRKQTGESMLVMTLVLTLSAAAIAIGIVYNNARIALSLRGRDLASLRVLGFTRREISGILLGELAIQVVLGIPLGFVLGTWGAELFAAGMDREAFRFPVTIASDTYAAAAVIALVSGLASALLVRRKLDQLDLVSVLKSSE
jgi:putative ABC transport system permease protein